MAAISPSNPAPRKGHTGASSHHFAIVGPKLMAHIQFKMVSFDGDHAKRWKVEQNDATRSVVSLILVI